MGRLLVNPEVSAGWVDPWVGLGWVEYWSEIFAFTGLGWVRSVIWWVGLGREK